MKKLTVLIAFSFFLILTSCGPETMEQQVEELITASNYKRKEIAFSLADSLDTRAVELLMGVHSIKASNEPLVKTTFRLMLTRYSQLYNIEEFKLQEKKIENCISYITEPSKLHSVTNNDKISFIIYGLLNIKNTNKLFQKSLVSSAKKHGTNAMLEIINKWKLYKSSKELLYAITLFEDKAISYLSDRIVDDKNAIELLARIGEPAVSSMKRKMRNNDKDIRFAAGDVLVEMIKYHPKSVTSLTSAIDKNSIRTIAKNYPFYIRLGQSGTESLLLKALSQNFSKEMCVDYLNCGSKILEDGSAKIARKNGYIVTPGFGGNAGPKWGSGN